jgi:hypothetical protein
MTDYTMNHLEEVWDDIDHADDDVWDNIQGFAPDDFARVYDLSETDSMILWQAVQARTDPRRCAYSQDPTRLGTVIQETLHQSLDGWTIEQGLIIQAYLSDVAYAVSQIIQDEQEKVT